MITNPADPHHWFLLARDRVEKADALFAAFGASWSGVELLQEGAERYLKGYLVACGWTLVKTHDLNRLLAVACDYNPAFAAFAEACGSLTEQFWEQHYPGGDLDEVGADYPELRRAVGGMIGLIEREVASASLPTQPDKERKPEA